MDRDAPIGIFDSGLGGLTVTHAILDQLPQERLVYLGDTARVPYGTRSAETVQRYARGCARRLQQQNIKLLVVACNTVSAVALEMLRAELDIPVLGVIEPSAEVAVRASRSGRIGVLATGGTIASGAYPRAVGAAERTLARGVQCAVFGLPAPLLVPLAEEGWTTGQVPELIIDRYLSELSHFRVDALVLGCTHYPLFRPLLDQRALALCGSDVVVVDSAEATAQALERLLHERDLARDPAKAGALSMFVTDMPGRFGEVASRFLGRPIEGLAIEQIDL
ncbi:MAG: Glutamate racemase [Myxococcaceae bacterium]|nr:Glutamate racemase [Myxococcaceae bacterium]